MSKTLKDIEKVILKPNDLVTVTKMNHIVEVQHMEKMNSQNNIKKLDKDRYLEISTGEIKEFNHIENRQQSYNSLRQTFKKLRYLINNNFIGNQNELHITLTYEENMTDTKRLYTDFNKFIKRLKYSYKDKTTIDYISVIEPQDRGAWHAHCLVRFNELEKIFIPNKFDKNKVPINAPLYDLWGHGYVTIKSIQEVDNIGAYLSAYLTDIELTEDNALKAMQNGNTIEVKNVEGQEKKFIKGGRLHMYPPGMNMYRKSKGIIPPEREKMSFKKIKKIVGSAQPHYEKKYEIEDSSTEFTNTISYLQYNTKRT